MSSADCTDAVAGFASADPTRLRPLPATCTLDDVTKTLHSLDARSRGELAGRTVAIHWFSSENLPKIHAWVDDTGHVVLLDADWPPGPADAFISALGPPEQKLDYEWRGSPLERAELLWPSRGAVMVSSDQVKGVIRIGVFAPTSLDDYKARLRYVDREEIDEG